MLSNTEILIGLRDRSNDVIRYIYISNYPPIAGWIKKNSGNEDDANDVFQESLLILYRKIEYEGISLECNFKTYIFSICKHLWFQELRRRSKQRIGIVEDAEYICLEEDFKREERIYKIYKNCLNKLETISRKVLLLSSQGKSNSEIRNQLGFTNNQAVADKKKNSKKKLIKELLDNKEYRQLINEIHEHH